ncbi:arylsulfatase [Bacteroidia bacterium]|nr:arylsulfatase [Bacteroidia bacterium]
MKSIPISLLIFPLAATAAARPTSHTRTPNFVIVVADDMGYGDLGCYGNKTILTPNVDRMAAEGIRFTDYHSNGAASTPTRAALLTGRYQQRAGMQGVHMPWDEATKNVGLQDGEVTFGHVLGQNGYKVALFGKWHVGTADYCSPNRRGFERFIGFRGANIDYVNHRGVEGDRDWWRDMEQWDEPGYATDLIASHACNYIRENKNVPFCIYVAHAAPHYPYQAPDDVEFRRENMGKQHQYPTKGHDAAMAYKAMIERFDKTMGDILASLKETGLAENTIIFIVSDNGPVGPGSPGALGGKKGMLLEGGHRVPGIVWGADAYVKGGRDCSETVIGMDIFPTMLDYASIKYNHARKPLDGASLRGVIGSGGKAPVRDLFWRNGNSVAIRSGKWKMILYKNGPVKTLLCDLEADAGEKTNLADARAALVDQLTAKIRAWEKSVDSEIKEQINN